MFDRDGWCCRVCGVMVTQGRASRRSAVGDHLRPARLAPEAFLDAENVWTVCKWCHDGDIKALEAQYWSTGADRIKSEKLKLKPLGLDGYRR